MKLAIISDIHANLQALETVIENAHEQGAEQFVCLGDIVGYGPQPAECLAIIRELNCPVIKGNHDHDASNTRDLFNLNDAARHSLEWTREQLTAHDKEWLASLPFTRRVGRITIAHATPHRPNLWQYVHDLAGADECLVEQEASLCFIGHTHVPGLFERRNGVTHEVTLENFKLSNEAKYLCNVGAVGQPRDGDPRASYAIYDRSTHSVERQRVAYDVQLTQSLMSERKLPESLVIRLGVAA